MSLCKRRLEYGIHECVTGTSITKDCSLINIWYFVHFTLKFLKSLFQVWVKMSFIFLIDSLLRQFSSFLSERKPIVFGLLIFIAFVSFARFLYKFYRFRELFDRIPGPKIQNLFYGNLSIITRGVNEKSGVDLYQGNNFYFIFTSFLLTTSRTLIEFIILYILIKFNSI